MSDARRPRILNVDDNDAGRYATSRILKEAGFDVVEAATGADALRLVADHPDLVLLDVNLPDIDGFEVCARIKADPASAAIAVVHLSATAIDSDARSEGLEGGADAYLTQPIGARELVATVRATLRLRDVEHLLQASERRFRSYFEQSLIALAVTSPDKGWMDVNQATCDLLGYSREELGRLTWAELTHADDLDADLAQFERVMAGESDGYRLEKRFIRKDGAVVDVDLSVHCERDADGHADYFLALLSDVTERKTAELARQAAEARRKAILDSMLDPHVLLQAVRDEAGVVVDFVIADSNEAACAFNGLPYDELMGVSLLGRHPAAGTTELFGMYAHVVESGEPLVLDDWSYPRDLLGGGLRFNDVRAVRVGDAVSQTWRDVTERHEAAAALAASEEQYRLLAENASDVVFRGTNEGVPTWFSPSVTALVGWLPGQLVGRSFAEVVHPDDLPRLRAAQAEVFVGTPATYEVRVRTADGGYRWVSITLRPIKDEAGVVVGRAGGWRDIQGEVEAREALEAREAELRTVLDIIPDAVFEIDRDYRLVFANDGYARATAATQGRVIAVGETVLDSEYPADVLEAWRGYYDRAFAGESFLEELSFPIAGGTYSTENSFSPLREGEEVVGAVVTSRDVTARKIAEAELRYAHARLELAQQASGAGTWDWDVVTGAIDWTAEMFALFGLDPETGEAGFDVWDAALHPDDLEAAHARIAAALADHETLDSDYRIVKPDGDVRWINALGRAMYGEDGEPLRMIGLCIDVTDLRRAEQAVRESEDKFRYVFENSVIGKALISPDGRVLSVNDALSRMLRRPRREIEGQFMRDFMTPEDAAATESETRRLVAGDVDTMRRRTCFLTKEGSVRWADASSSLRRDEAGGPLYFIASIVDVTDEVEAEEEIARLNVDLERRVAERTRELSLTNAELEEFVYSIAHDLRAPLRALAGFSEIVSTDYRDAVDATGRDYLGRIRAAAGHMGRVMDSLLALSRVNRSDLLMADVDLSAIAGEIVQRLRQEDPLRAAEFEIEDGLVARADAALCDVLLQNLLGNAWKFSAGESLARISFGVVTAEGRRAYCVSDNGVGFEQQYVGRLFRPFERLHASNEFPGAGIGLATVRRVVARFGGECWAEGEVGVGAAVFFTLPVGAEDSA